MGEVAIRAEGLGKKFRLGLSQDHHRTLRDTLAHMARRPVRAIRSLAHGAGNSDRPRQETIWALKHVSFEIKRGEVVGVIGRNGAGKSTLLKILSRITEPTEGYAEIRGRVGSLLDVGTGFHPELTGRENIYLNGAILGMRRLEIDRRFDEMVAFAEVEKFIDTPVKHYSSGMYLRLAFAVAAHLDPEILLVDEVLAVGDVAFQNRCLDRMKQFAGEGRAVLFVSHNMNAIAMLCDSAMLLENGRVAARGPARLTLRRYLGESNVGCGRVVFDEASPAGAPHGGVRLCSISLEDEGGRVRAVFASSEVINVVLDLEVDQPKTGLCIGFDLDCHSVGAILRTYQNDLAPSEWPVIRAGRNRLRCSLPARLLNGGAYSVSPRIGLHCKEWLVKLDNVVSFEVTLDHGVSPYWVVLDGNNRPGAIAPILRWVALPRVA